MGGENITFTAFLQLWSFCHLWGAGGDLWGFARELRVTTEYETLSLKFKVSSYDMLAPVKGPRSYGLQLRDAFLYSISWSPYLLLCYQYMTHELDSFPSHPPFPQTRVQISRNPYPDNPSKY